ncbi:nucleotide sugar dehydrogenase [Listeria fleischmannii]|uniref:nucleotide sugar dehydrogenase n=1 Tax=Listeria fleischmannii TaxID=1069827 RepID=UPI000254F205|nr:nucleotide sugar dehydrogenase [Listeria fleischmannii]EIA19708.1 UDP-glucose dehydrogenase [Listeria fleischmannii subsp. coloradonensis]STY34555.1 GDP-mannose 6-dehydrogenase [Listeria fleischmannii subsp. coloradonensis]
MKIVTIGLGYIGLPTAIMFANHEQDVIGVDIKEDVIETLNKGHVHLEEPGLEAELQKAIEAGRFKAQTNVEAADAFIIAVPTPNKNDDYKSCDLTYVIDGVKSVLPFLEKGNTVIVESTIAPRTTEDVVKPLIEEAGFTIGKDIFLVHCPERVLPGKILHELKYNNRIIGGVTDLCTEAGKKIYSIFVEGELIASSASAAELSKLMENTYRDVNIALANELVKIGDDLNIDALEVIEMANKHPRVNIHSPGPGVGGHCLAVDPYFIVASTPETTPLIQTARAINTSMPDFVFDKTKELMAHIHGKKITVLGVTYKGNVDDIRESPALEIAHKLIEDGTYQISIFDPHVDRDWIEKDFKEATRDSDLLLVLSDHNEFKNIVEEDLSEMKQLYVFDTKNVFPSELKLDKYTSLGNIAWLNEAQRVSSL